MANVKLVPVHYRGAAPALNDLLGGHINLISMGPSIALPQVGAGQLKMLAVGSSKRLPQLPDVPTVDESACRDTRPEPGSDYLRRRTPRAPS